MDIFIPQEIIKHFPNLNYKENKVGLSGSKIISVDNLILKIEKTSEESDNEYRILKWLQGKAPVPKVIAVEKHKGYNYLLMSKVPGYMAFEEEVMSNPVNMIYLLAKGLKVLWEVDIKDCPYSNNLENKFRLAKYRLANSLCDIEDVDPDTFSTDRFHNFKGLLEWLIANKPKEDLVFSHGDYCLPNVLFKGNEISGFVDLGRSGIADKWQDVALCIRSMKYNLGEVYDDKYTDYFLNELDLKPDWEKIEYYILLDELF